MLEKLCNKKNVDYLMWFAIINIASFLFKGMGECIWIKGNKICKTFSSLIVEICTVICVFIVCIVWYGKKIKYKKLKILLLIMACSVVQILCESFISEKIDIVFNYNIYIVIHLLLIGVCIIYMKTKGKEENEK